MPMMASAMFFRTRARPVHGCGKGKVQKLTERFVGSSMCCKLKAVEIKRLDMKSRITLFEWYTAANFGEMVLE